MLQGRLPPTVVASLLAECPPASHCRGFSPCGVPARLPHCRGFSPCGVPACLPHCRGFSPCGVPARLPHCRGFSPCGVRALRRQASVIALRGLSSCGAPAELPRGTWHLPGPGTEPVSPALAGGFLTTRLPGKPRASFHLN